MKREIPTGLAETCLQAIGRTLRVQLVAGWGWHHYINGVQQPLGPNNGVDSGKVEVTVQSFFRDESRPTGLTGIIHAPGHKLDKFKAVFFTMSDGVDFDFSQNICTTWAARFGDQEPVTEGQEIPTFQTGTVYYGYATVYQDEESLAACRERLKKSDPRKGSGAAGDNPSPTNP